MRRRPWVPVAGMSDPAAAVLPLPSWASGVAARQGPRACPSKTDNCRTHGTDWPMSVQLGAADHPRER